MSKKPRLLYCHCAWAQVVPADVKNAVLRGLCESGETFETAADLCEMSARRDAALERLADGGPLKIAACYPRAVKWLFAAAGTPLSPEKTEILNMRCESADAVRAAMLDPIVHPSSGADDGPDHESARRNGPAPANPSADDAVSNSKL